MQEHPTTADVPDSVLCLAVSSELARRTRSNQWKIVFSTSRSSTDEEAAGLAGSPLLPARTCAFFEEQCR